MVQRTKKRKKRRQSIHQSSLKKKKKKKNHWLKIWQMRMKKRMLLTLNSDEYIVSFWNKATCKRTQQLPITHNKRTQHVTSNNFASVWPGYAMIANSVKHTQTSINRPLAKFCSRTARSLCGASRDFKMPRRRRQRKEQRQKSNRLQIGKTKTVHMKHTFLYISFRHCKITTRKCLVSP